MKTILLASLILASSPAFAAELVSISYELKIKTEDLFRITKNSNTLDGQISNIEIDQNLVTIDELGITRIKPLGTTKISELSLTQLKVENENTITLTEPSGDIHRMNAQVKKTGFISKTVKSVKITSAEIERALKEKYASELLTAVGMANRHGEFEYNTSLSDYICKTNEQNLLSCKMEINLTIKISETSVKVGKDL